MRASLALVAAGLLACGAPPRPSAPRAVPAPPDTSARTRALPNGLAVYAEQRPGEVAVVQLWVAAGAVDEDPAGRGAAFALERQILARLVAVVAPLGGRADAWSMVDATAFELTVPAAALAPALAGLAEAITTAPDAPPAEALAAWDAAATAARGSARRALEAALAGLRPGDPWARSPLPDSTAFAALTGPATAALHRARYAPDAARLVVIGPTAPPDVLAAAAPLGRWTGAATARPRPAAPRAAPRVRVDRIEGGPGTLTLAFALPPVDADGALALDRRAVTLSERLGPRLRALTPTARLDVFAWTPRDAPALIVRVEVPPPQVDAAFDRALDAVAGLRDAPLTPAERARAAQQVGASAGDRRPAARAAQVGLAWLRFGAVPDPAAVVAAPADAAPPVSATALSAVVRTPLEPAVDAALWGESLAERAAALAAVPPTDAAGRLRPSPGVEVWIHPMPGAGTVALHAEVEGGFGAEPAEQVGLAAAVAGVLALPHPGEPSAEAWAAPDHVALRTQVAPEDFERALTALARRLGPGGPARADLARVPPGAPTDEALPLVRRVVFGAAHPFARPAHCDAAALAALSPAAARAWHDLHVARAPLRLVIVGDLDPARAGRAVRRAFRGRPPVHGPRAVPPAQPADLRLTAAGAQPRRVVAWPVRIDDGDQAAQLQVLGAWLAEAAAGSGVAAVPYGELAPTRGYLAVDLQGEAAATAAAAERLDAALAAARAGAAPPPAFEAARAALIARATVTLAAPRARAAWLARNAAHALPWTGTDALERWRGAVGRVTPARAQTVATRLTQRVEAAVARPAIGALR